MTLFNQTQPQALVVNTNMPDDQAYTLIRQIKEIELTQDKQIATIALTASTSSVDRRQALRSGFQVCLTQPIETS